MLTHKFAIRSLLMSTVLPGSLLLGHNAVAQIDITDARTEPVKTSDANNGSASDVTVTSTGSIKVTTGTALTLDSDNAVVVAGTVGSDDSDNTVGVNLVGGNTGSLTLSATGDIALTENYTPADDDGDGIPDRPVASGSGRTGILISGASPFIGNVTLQAGSGVTVEGNDSYAFRLMEGAGLTGDILTRGSIAMIGDDSRGISIEDQVIGNLATSGRIDVSGQGSSAVVIEGDIDGQYVNDGTIQATGYRLTTRPSAPNRILLDDDDFWQAGSAIQVSANVSNGVYLREVITTITNDDGTTSEVLSARSTVTQYGSAPAVLIDGQGTPIAIGIVAAITDPADEDYDADLQYAFVNQGLLTARGVFDDINATAFQVADTTLANGINNTNLMQSFTFRSGDDGTADAEGMTGLARVIVFGSGAIAESINNSGVMLASATEASDEVYADRDNIVPARQVRAIAIDINANAEVSRLVNSGSILALVTARDGEAIALLDSSGTLNYIENTGFITARGVTSDSVNEVATDYNLVAIDLSANTSGVTLLQNAHATSQNDPAISGDIFLGDGDDTVTITAGTITGDLDMAGGVNALSLSGGSSYTGHFSETGNMLALSVTEGSSFNQTGVTPINTSSAYFDSTSSFRPTLNGETGAASTLSSTGDITFEDGATISPYLLNVVDNANNQFTILDAGGSLNITSDISSLLGIETPYLYDTTLALDPNDPNALIITLDLRSPESLGLDSVQGASFNSAYEALQNNSNLANAFVNIHDSSTFNQAINQLLPEFAAAARQFVIANVDGATGAVATHLNNSRYSQVKPGSVWLEEFGYFADRDLAGLSEQYRGHGFGFTGGIDTAFGPFHALGLNLGFASTQIEDVVGFDKPMNVITFQYGGYGGMEFNRFSVDGYVGGGHNKFEQTRNIEIGDFNEEAKGKWSGNHLNASLRAGYDFWLGEKNWLRPSISVDYLRLKEDAYTETGPTGIALQVDERTSELAGTTAMVDLGTRWYGKRTWLRPSLRAGYRHEFVNDGVVTDYQFVGLQNRAQLISQEFPKDGFLLGFSLAAGSRYSSVSLDFDTDIRDGFIRNTGRLIVRLIF